MSRNAHDDPRVLATLEDPRRDRPFLSHDWRRHVPPALRDTWDTLPLDTRLCVYESAELSAMDEDSDSVMVAGTGSWER